MRTVTSTLMVAALALVVFAEPVLAKPRAKGAVLLPPDQYAALPSVPRYRSFLPRAADLSPWFPTPGHQGEQPSCTAWATAYALRSYYENRLAPGGRATAPMSPAYVYNSLSRPRGACTAGLPVPWALDFIKDRGVPPLAHFAYSEKSCNRLPDAAVEQVASAFRISSWKALKPAKLDDVKGQIAAGHPAVIAMMIADPAFTEFKGGAVFDDSTPSNDPHAMVAVGYDDARQAFRIINSWGTEWADNGFAWISYRVFTTHVVEAYAAQIGQPVPPAPLPDEPPAEKVAVPPPPQPAPQPVVVPPPKPQPKPQPVVQATPSLEQARQAVNRLGRTLRCGAVSATASGGRLRVSGYVSSEEDRYRVAGAVNQLAPGQADLMLSVQPWPVCEALETFARPLATPRGLAVAIGNPRPGPSLKAGDPLRLQVTTPDYPSWLYLSYVQADGTVIHMRRYSDGGNRPLPPRTVFTVGEGGNMTISGPVFGSEMVLAVASKLPLLALERPRSETEREFLTEFRLAILAQQAVKGADAVSAVIVPLKTEP